MTEDQSDEQVRRLLAEARHDEPMPEDVAARLDRVIGDLADEPRRSATVVRLADRRRRATRMLVAAAAVVAVGVGGAQLIPGLEGSTSSSESAAGGAADEPMAAEGESAPQDSAGGSEPGVADEPTRPYELRSQRFSRDAAALQALSDDLDVAEDSSGRPGRGASSYVGESLRRATKQTVCQPGDWGRGGFFAVVYDGTPGWMVLRPPAGDTQVADLFLCGSEEAVRSVTLPAR